MVDAISITFTEAVSDFDPTDIRLTLSGIPLDLTGATLTSADNTNWVLGNIPGFTAKAGNYQLDFRPSNDITDRAGNSLAGSTPSTWLTGFTADPLPAIDFKGGQAGLRARAQGNLTVLKGSKANDVLGSGATSNLLAGGDGNDMIRAQGNRDKVIAGAGNDRVWGGTGNDILLGNFDNDFLNGGAGKDVIKGGKDDDILYGGKDEDTLMCTIKGITLADISSEQFIVGRP